MKKSFVYTTVSFLAICICTIVLNINLAEAQSGRRVQPPPPPPPSPSSEPSRPAPPREVEAPPPPAQKPAAEQIQVLYTFDDNRLELPANLSGAVNVVVGACAERLAQANALNVVKEKEMNRKQASDRAKTEDQRSVIWVQLQVDTFGGQSPTRLEDFHVEYIIFSPKDAKVKSQNRIYLRPYQPRVGVGGIAVPLPIPRVPLGVGGNSNALYYSLQQAGIETADRIMQAFKITPPPIDRRP